jgi:hypothetical protein
MKLLRKFENFDDNNKWFTLIDSMVDIMDKFGIIYYEEENGEWSPPKECYHEVCFGLDGKADKIVITNFDESPDINPREVIEELRKHAKAYSRRVGFKVGMMYNTITKNILIYEVK